MSNPVKSFDLSDRKVITARDAQAAHLDGAQQVLIGQGSVITPSAQDFLQQNHIAVTKDSTYSELAQKKEQEKPVSRPTPNPKLFTTPEAEVIKKEICEVGRKLWLRQFVDGNGGNISYRIGPNEVLCTPTMVSKYDLTPEQLCMVDLDGNQIAGSKPRTSEILLHLEIYKAVPEAKSAVHCHPPHATAYAITGRIPPNLIIPEYEVLVGKVAYAPYETPGTSAFARTVLPFVKDHNTVLLGNHGIICWADTATHAEWYAEVLDTYCWTLMLAAQLGAPITSISEEKGAQLLEIKKRLGLPDARYEQLEKKAGVLSDPRTANQIAVAPEAGASSAAATVDLELLVKSVTDAVLKAIGGK